MTSSWFLPYHFANTENKTKQKKKQKKTKKKNKRKENAVINALHQEFCGLVLFPCLHCEEN